MDNGSACGGAAKWVIGSPTAKYMSPMPMPAANSIATQGIYRKSGIESSGPSFTFDEATCGEEDDGGEENGH
jgi:hypothetical protein